MSITTYTQGHDAATLSSHQTRSAEEQAGYLIPYIKEDSQILDVGCGPGTITCGFAKLCPRGKVVGLDYSETVLEQARREATERGLENVNFQAGSAFDLPFDDKTFDVVHCHALLCHLPNAINALREMVRVCKIGGYIGIREPDIETCVIHPHFPPIERWHSIRAQLIRSEGAEPNAGRFLAQWAITSGLHHSKLSVTCDVLQHFGQEARERWVKIFTDRLSGELTKRAVKLGLMSSNEIEEIAAAYLEWSENESGLWAMMHVRLLAQRG